MRKSLFPLVLLLISICTYAQPTRSQLKNTLSPADKVYGLSKFWMEVNYNFIYLDKVDRQMWDSTYRAMIESVQKTPNDYEYFRELQRFCALLKDGHTNVYQPDGIEQMTTMFGDYRFFIENIDNKAIIVRTNLSKKDEIPVGSEVIEVNGLPTAQYIKEKVSPYIASSTDYVLQNWSIARLFQGFNGDTYQIKIKKPKGEVINLTITHKTTTEKEVFPAFPPNRNLLDFQWYNNNQVAYVSLNSFGDQKIDTLFVEKLPELYKAKALIIDLRYNGGGSTSIGRYILDYLTNDSLLYGSRNASRQHIPSFKAWGKFTNPADTMNNAWATKSLLMYQDRYMYPFDYAPTDNHLSAKDKRIVVPTVILTGNETASAAEDFLIFADRQKHMIKIGGKTFGSTGQPYMFDLPGGGSARVCTKKDTYPDGREFVGYGIIPDIEIKPTINDYLQKKDPVLDKALEYLKTKIK